MSQLTDRLERDLREIATGAHPSPSAWESIAARLGDDGQSEVAPMLAPAPRTSKRPVWLAVAAAVLVVFIGSIAVLTRADDDQSISTVDLPNLTTTFVSPKNGFAVSYDKRDGTVTPAGTGSLPTMMAPASPSGTCFTASWCEWYMPTAGVDCTVHSYV